MMSASDAKAKANDFLEEKARTEKTKSIKWAEDVIALKIESAAERGSFSIEVYIPGEITIKYVQDHLHKLGYKTEMHAFNIAIFWN
jgi:hypothetical protein